MKDVQPVNIKYAEKPKPYPAALRQSVEARTTWAGKPLPPLPAGARMHDDYEEEGFETPYGEPRNPRDNEDVRPVAVDGEKEERPPLPPPKKSKSGLTLYPAYINGKLHWVTIPGASTESNDDITGKTVGRCTNCGKEGIAGCSHASCGGLFTTGKVSPKPASGKPLLTPEEAAQVRKSMAYFGKDAETFKRGDKVRNTYGETGVVVEQNGTNVVVRPGRHTGSPENWHVTKTFKTASAADADDPQTRLDRAEAALRELAREERERGGLTNTLKEEKTMWERELPKIKKALEKAKAKDSVKAVDVEGYTEGGVFHPISGSKGYRPGKTASGRGHGPKRKKKRARARDEVRPV